jgi:hypothetical protein
MKRPSTARFMLTSILSALTLCMLLGCGGEKTYRLSGKVTFKGQPIPSGKIFFVPDTSKGNKGPSGYAEIKDGNYDTSAPGGSGIVGGPMLITINASNSTDPDKLSPKGMFPPYQTSADLPKSDSTKDIDVPADAIKGGKKN